MGRIREIISKKDIKLNYPNPPLFWGMKEGKKQIRLINEVNGFLKDEAQKTGMRF